MIMFAFLAWLSEFPPLWYFDFTGKGMSREIAAGMAFVRAFIHFSHILIPSSMI
jgi:hypothetical protein